jgi:flagella basal body P-ring formation protein FlgA
MRSSGRLVLVAALAVAVPAAAERIAVAPESLVRGASVRLGDVAVLEGERVRGLAGLVLADAPTPGESRSIAGTRVLDTLRRELGGLDGVRYTIPSLVRVRRAAQEIPGDALRELVERFLVERLATGEHEPRLRGFEVAGPVRIAPGPFDARVTAPAGAPLVGRTRLAIEFAQDGEPAARAWVTADVGLEGPVVVTRRALGRGEPVLPEDLAVERREVSDRATGLVTDPAEAAGRVARVPVAALTPLRREHLAAPAAVRRGDAVLLVAERGGVRLTVPGEVRDEAALGEAVRVTNRVSRKEVIGRVRDARTVAVDF